jgi:adenosylcobinamide-phosphate synthase
MIQPAALIFALLLDAVIGDPDALWRRVPHPAALMGRLISALEKRLNRGGMRHMKGLVTLAAVIVVSGGIACLIRSLPGGALWEVGLAAILLAQNSLMRHVGAVARGLDQGLDEGRAAVGRIVGRDASVLDQSGVARSAIESAAENFSDGVVAPVFWFVIFGLPGIAIYKAVNTADSMIGYRNERYEAFGWAAARLDDVLNWVPARLSGLLICAVHGSGRAVQVMRRDAPLHRSPNAGWPEAATAAVLGVAISGPRSYGGRKTDDPFVHPEGRRYLTARDVDAAVRAIWRAWAGLFGLALIWWGLTW